MNPAIPFGSSPYDPVGVADHFHAPFRTLSAQDVSAVLGHFEALSREDLLMRFGALVSKDWLADYAARLVTGEGVAIGFSTGPLIAAIGELRPSISGQAAICEFGLSVIPELQGRGLGRRLFDRLRHLAASHRYRTAELYIDAHNAPMTRICQAQQPSWSREGSLLHCSFLL